LDETLKREETGYSETGSYKGTRRHLAGQNSVYVLRYQGVKIGYLPTEKELTDLLVA
jgi:hypothetical protein